MSELTIDDIIKMIEDQVEKVPNYVAYYSLRDYKVPRVRDASIKLLKTCIALEELGLPITTDLLEAVLGDRRKLYTILHRLGDYNVIDNVETENHQLVYKLNEDFKEHVKLPRN